MSRSPERGVGTKWGSVICLRGNCTLLQSGNKTNSKKIRYAAANFNKFLSPLSGAWVFGLGTNTKRPRAETTGGTLVRSREGNAG